MTNYEKLKDMSIGEFLELHKEHYEPDNIDPEYSSGLRAVKPFTMLYCQMQCCCFCPVMGSENCLEKLDEWLDKEAVLTNRERLISMNPIEFESFVRNRDKDLIRLEDMICDRTMCIKCPVRHREFCKDALAKWLNEEVNDENN